MPGDDTGIVGTTRTLRARGRSEQSPAMVQLTRDFEKIRKQVSRRRTHVPEWMRVWSLVFFVAVSVYLSGMYIYGTLQDDNEQTAVISPDGGIGGYGGGDGPATTTPVDDGGGGSAAGQPVDAEQLPGPDLGEPQPGLATVAFCENNQTTSLIPQIAYDTAEQSVEALFTGDYAALVVADNASVPDITQPGFVLYANPLVLPGCLYATGDISYAFQFVVDPDGDGPVAARTIRTIVEHNVGGPRWVGY